MIERSMRDFARQEFLSNQQSPSSSCGNSEAYVIVHFTVTVAMMYLLAAVICAV